MHVPRMGQAAHSYASLITVYEALTLVTRSTSRFIIDNRNRNLQISKAPLESQAQGTSLLTSAASSQKGCPRE